MLKMIIFSIFTQQHNIQHFCLCIIGIVLTYSIRYNRKRGRINCFLSNVSFKYLRLVVCIKEDFIILHTAKLPFLSIQGMRSTLAAVCDFVKVSNVTPENLQSD